MGEKIKGAPEILLKPSPIQLFYRSTYVNDIALYKRVENLSRKLYNNRDKLRGVVLWQTAFIQK